MMEIRMPRLHAAQAEIIDSKARFKVLACGRRFGKTTIAIDLLCDHLLEGKSVAYFAPTYRMGSEVWRELQRILRPVIEYSREEDWRMELRTGGVFEGWSLAQGSGEMVRGRKYHFVVMDEAALFDSADVWHGAIRPLLTDYEGTALFCSTPKGRGWFWQLYQQGQDPDLSDWQSWRYPTAANPHINPAEIEAARQGMPERFYQQEYEAEFLDDGGVVFRNVERVCTATPIPPTPFPHHEMPMEKGGEEKTLTPAPSSSASGRGEKEKEREGEGWRVKREAEPEETVGSGEAVYYFGVDWGKDNDYTCVSVMTREGKQVYIERFNHIGWNIQRARLAALYERFKPLVILAEENSMGSVNIEALQAEGLPMKGFTTTSKSKAPLIEGLALAMEREEVVLLNHPVLKHELMAYEMAKTAYGWKYGAPPGGHDDTVMATALSLWATRNFGRILILWV